MAGLTKEQKKIIREIEKEAIDAGVDPDFAIALANLESTFQHIPAEDKKSTAFGPFQVNKATAEANGVDYEEMKKNPELAIKTGIKNIARHMNNPTFEGDPARIAAAHRYGENSEYAKTGDPSKIDSTLRDYLLGVAGHYQNEEFPQTISTKKPEGESKSQEPELDMGKVPITPYSQKDEEADDRQLAAEEGALVGGFLGTVKAPAWNVGSRIWNMAKNMRQGNVSPQDLADMTEAAMRVKQQGATPAGEQTTIKPSTPEPTGPNAKYTAKFGQGVQLTPAEIASSTGMGKGDTEAWGLIKKAREANEKISNLYGSGSYTLDPERGLMLDTSVGGGSRGATTQPKVPMQAPLEQRQAEAIKKYTDWANSVNATPQPKAGWRTTVPQAARKVGEVARTVANSSPVRWGFGGMGTLANLENASQQFGHNTPLGNVAGTTSLGAALASGLSMVPSLASKANPAAIALTAGSQALGDIDRGDYESAKAKAYLGGLGLASLPVAVGALIPSSLNKGEEEELARYRRMQPPHLRP